MWKATSTRLSHRLRCARCRRQFASSTKTTREIPVSFKETPSPPRPGGTSGGGGGGIPPPPPPKLDPLPPKKTGGGFLLKIFGMSALTAGGIVAYAWYDRSFQKAVEKDLPYSKEFFEILFPYLPDRGSPSAKSTSVTKPGQLPYTTQVEKKDTKPATTQKTEPQKSEPPPVDKKAEKERLKREAEKKLKDKEAEEAAENAALEVIIEDLLVTTIRSTQKAIDIQKKVIETTKEHTKLLKTAMEDTSKILEKDNQWQAVSTAFEAREQAVKESEKMMCNARADLEKLKHAIEDGKNNAVTKKNKIIMKAQETLNKHNNELGNVSAQVSRAESDAKIMTKYKDLVDKGRKQFQKELECILPDIKLKGKQGKKLSEEELNSLIAHAHRRIEQLQKQLAEQLAMEADHIEKALEHQIQEDEKMAEMRVKLELEKMQANFDVQKENWNAESRADFEKELRYQLARQAAAHSDHLKDVLRVQLEEMEDQFERQLLMKILEEQQSFRSEIAGWIARLKGIEAAVDERAAQEKIARMSQELWVACLALNGAIRLGNEDGEEWEDRRKPLTDEIHGVSDASKQHPFVETIIRTIPEEAVKRGVMTEDILKERFRKVKQVCRRVAMIDETGGSLFKYFISYLQSFFIVESVNATDVSDKILMDKLDTFSILAHADYFLQKGDFEQAVRFMNQLVGEPRRVAEDWLKEATLLLETRQAADVLTAFASANGLSSLL